LTVKYNIQSSNGKVYDHEFVIAF